MHFAGVVACTMAQKVFGPRPLLARGTPGAAAPTPVPKMAEVEPRRRCEKGWISPVSASGVRSAFREGRPGRERPGTTTGPSSPWWHAVGARHGCPSRRSAVRSDRALGHVSFLPKYASARSDMSGARPALNSPWPSTAPGTRGEHRGCARQHPSEAPPQADPSPAQ